MRKTTAIFFGIQSLIYNFALSALKGSLKNIIMLGVVTPLLAFMILGLLS